MSVATEAVSRSAHAVIRRSRRARVAVVGLALLAVVTGCSAGQQAQTSHEFSVQDGASATVGSMALRHVNLASPSDPNHAAGSDVVLNASIVNDGTATDTLESVSATVAGSVYTEGTATTSSSTGAGDTGVPSDTSSSSTSSSSSPSASGSPSGSGTSTSSGTQTFSPIDIPATTLVTVGDRGTVKIYLGGLKQTLYSGTTTPVVFTFAQAGSITVQVPVQLQQDNTGGPTIDIAPTGEG